MQVAIGRQTQTKKCSRKTLYERMKPYGGLYFIALPGIVFLLIFRYLPMYGVIIAFKNFNVMKGILGSDFVGLKNFVQLFQTEAFPLALRNTLLLSVYNLLWGFPVPILLALLLNEVRVLPFKKTVQTITYIPHFFSWVVISGIFIDILSPSTGIVNTLIQSVGLKPVFFMASPKLIRSILVFSNVWKETGWSSILYLATISSIDENQYEAAAIDGAGRLRQAISITIPALKSTIIILLIMALGNIMGDNFEQILMMSNSAVQDKVDVIDTYVYRQSFLTLQFGLTSAAGLFKSVINCFLLILSNRIVKTLGGSGMY